MKALELAAVMTLELFGAFILLMAASPTPGAAVILKTDACDHGAPPMLVTIASRPLHAELRHGRHGGALLVAAAACSTTGRRIRASGALFPRFKNLRWRRQPIFEDR